MFAGKYENVVTPSYRCQMIPRPRAGPERRAQGPPACLSPGGARWGFSRKNSTAGDPGSGVDQVVSERVADQLGARSEVQLLLDAPAVTLDRARGQKQLVGDFGVGMSQGDQAQDVELTL